VSSPLLPLSFFSLGDVSLSFSVPRGHAGPEDRASFPLSSAGWKEERGLTSPSLFSSEGSYSRRDDRSEGSRSSFLFFSPSGKSRISAEHECSLSFPSSLAVIPGFWVLEPGSAVLFFSFSFLQNSKERSESGLPPLSIFFSAPCFFPLYFPALVAAAFSFSFLPCIALDKQIQPFFPSP